MQVRRVDKLLPYFLINLIKKLLSFFPKKGKFEDGKAYGLDKCVYANDLEKFFKSKPIKRSIKNIKKLKILGKTVVYLNQTFNFNRLAYLEAERICFQNSTILSNSSNLETLILRHCLLPGVNDINFNAPSLNPNLNIKRFSWICNQFLIDINFFKYCIKNGLLKSIETIDMIQLLDLDTLVYLIENFSTLKKINCTIGKDLEQFIAMINQNKLNQIANKLKPSTKLHTWGFFLTKESSSILRNFFIRIQDLVVVQCITLVFLMIDDENKHLIGELKKNEHLLTEFFKLIKAMDNCNQFLDEDLFKKLVNCDSVKYFFDEENVPGIKFKKALKSLSITSKLGMINDSFNVHYSNEILDLVPVYCPSIEHYYLDFWQSTINFNFLFKLSRLRVLLVRLGHAIDQSTFIELIRQLKYLNVFDVYFIKPTNMEKEQLSAFKKLVLQCLKEDNTSKNFDFKIQIYSFKKGVKKVVKYAYYLNNSFVSNFIDESADQAKAEGLLDMHDHHLDVQED